MNPGILQSATLFFLKQGVFPTCFKVPATSSPWRCKGALPEPAAPSSLGTCSSETATQVGDVAYPGNVEAKCRSKENRRSSFNHWPSISVTGCASFSVMSVFVFHCLNVNGKAGRDFESYQIQIPPENSPNATS